MTIASDIYALGVVLHIMLTGQAPARVSDPVIARRNTARVVGSATPTATLGQVQECDWQRKIGDLPSPWRAVVNRCLSVPAENRYVSAAEVIQAIQPKRHAAKWAAAAAAIAVVTIWQWPHPAGPPVRLAMLPPSVEGAALPEAAGVMDDVASRLASAQGNFIVISPAEASRNKVDSVAKAKTILGATHILQTRLQRGNGEITALASIVDTTSGLSLRQLKGSYAPSNISVMAKALTSTIAGAFQLRGAVQQEVIAPAAYTDYTQGVALFGRGVSKADDAIAAFEKAASLDPKSALPLAWLARVHLQRFNAGYGREWLARASDANAKARSINPDAYMVLYVSGGIKRHNGQYEQAAQDYLRATEISPGEPEAWRNLAVVYAAMNRPDQAIASYNRAINAKPGYYAPYLDFGIFYLSLGQYPQAEAQLRKAIELAPANTNSHVELGIALVREGKLEEAEKSFRAALDIDETPVGLVNLGQLYFSQRRYNDASRLFERSLQVAPPTATRYSNLGDAYEGLGRRAEAAAAYRKALALAETEVTLNPRRAESRALLAGIAASLGERSRADFELAQALQMDPQNVEVRRWAIFAYEQLKDRRKAIAVAQDSPKPLLAELNRDPTLAGLQADPQFQRLLKQ